jgi:hypothetical protein
LHEELLVYAITSSYINEREMWPHDGKKHNISVKVPIYNQVVFCVRVNLFFRGLRAGKRTAVAAIQLWCLFFLRRKLFYISIPNEHNVSYEIQRLCTKAGASGTNSTVFESGSKKNQV